jgi:hypothetical protein
LIVGVVRTHPQASTGIWGPSAHKITPWQTPIITNQSDKHCGADFVTSYSLFPHSETLHGAPPWYWPPEMVFATLYQRRNTIGFITYPQNVEPFSEAYSRFTIKGAW